ncbi:hypothetical protein BS50DRAFT_574751 [Corynespora cassiicola Philippines]|uniref:DUF1308 domain-containing protein n=1 Tax=Corynespora cassiicola Philippines TaxID=1448308 RepID=A0A2T2NLJ6_CORCC|nr:hypothetical protein BS50DRAFT_574751 [Corynespora cassiicola Philippines]
MADPLASNMQNLDLSPDGQGPSLGETVDELINRCQTLHEEVETYVAAVDAHQKQSKVQSSVEYRALRNDFKNELAYLRKLKGTELSPEQVRHNIASSNLLYHEALWAAAKRSSGLESFRKYFFWNRHRDGHPTKGLSLAKGSQTKGKTSALVDIVAAEGTEWVRVSTLSEKRLLFELAKLGWQNDDSDDSDEELAGASKNWEDEDDDDQVDVVKNARDLARAARANPICGHPPRVRFVLTRIETGRVKEVDAILDKIKDTGAIVQCANELPPTPPLSVALPNLLIDRSRNLSHTLNIDCTILLALISDISHADCPILDWYPAEVRAQIKEEDKEKLLPTHLYPALGSHPMVCTEEAANQMQVIVDTLATDTEKTRARLILGMDEFQDGPPEKLMQTWAEMSIHAVPEGFQLPIRVKSSNLEQAFGKKPHVDGTKRTLSRITEKLPAIASKIAKELGPLNQAIFLYGWAEGYTTVSSNRARARQIDHVINEHGLKDGEAGPHIWLCGESRSLIAKQGRRK